MLIDLDLYDLLEDFAPSPLVQGLHAKQQAAYYNPARFACDLWGRRTGKSHESAVELLGGRPGQVSLYFARTIKSAKSIMIPAFRALNFEWDLGLSFNMSDYTITEPNGAIIQLAGVKDEAAAENLRGPKYRKVIGDECFVVGTPINSIGRVLAQTDRPAPTVLISVDGVTSTPDHPYLTPKGWKRAEDIRVGDLLCVWDDFHSTVGLPPEQDVLEAMPEPAGGGFNQEGSAKGEARAAGLYGVREALHAQVSVPTVRDLFEGLPLRALFQDPEGERSVHHSASAFCKNLGPARAGDAGAAGRVRAEVLGDPEEDRASADRARRERPWAYVAGVPAGECNWLETKPHRGDREQKGHPDTLQVGPCRPIGEAGRGGGWIVAPDAARQGARSPKGHVARWKRVDRVEVHERGGQGRYDEVCPDGRVYNLTTESGLYFAGGRLVHNCGTFHSELMQYTVQDVLQPALVDSNGSMRLRGTPGEDPDPKDFWFSLTGDPASGIPGAWPTSHATIFDNTKMLVDPRLAITDILRDNNWTEDSPTFRREYMGEWVPDVGSLVFDYSGDFEQGPDMGLTILVMDFGVVDHTSFTVLRQPRDRRPHVWVMQSISHADLDIVQIAGIANAMRERWKPNHILGDEGGLGKGYALTLNRQFNIPVKPAEKKHLRARIDMGRGMLAAGLVHLTPEAKPLFDEWKKLPWNADKSAFHERYPADNVDAWLYGLQLINALEPYQPPKDERTEAQRIRDIARANAMRAATRATNQRRAG